MQQKQEQEENPILGVLARNGVSVGAMSEHLARMMGGTPRDWEHAIQTSDAQGISRDVANNATSIYKKNEPFLHQYLGRMQMR